MKAEYLLRQNIKALLAARGQSAHELAVWCRRTDSWISRVLSGERQRGIPIKYYDRFADFFGLATYQLFQPGISHLTERRKDGERRIRPDRRISRLVDTLRATPKHVELESKLRQLEPDNLRKVARWIDGTLQAQDSPPDQVRPGDPPASTALPAVPARRTRGRQ